MQHLAAMFRVPRARRKASCQPAKKAFLQAISGADKPEAGRQLTLIPYHSHASGLLSCSCLLTVTDHSTMRVQIETTAPSAPVSPPVQHRQTHQLAQPSAYSLRPSAPAGSSHWQAPAAAHGLLAFTAWEGGRGRLSSRRLSSSDNGRAADSSAPRQKRRWTQEEETHLYHQLGSRRHRRDFSRAKNGKSDYLQMAEDLNERFHQQDPGIYSRWDTTGVKNKETKLRYRYKELLKKQQESQASYQATAASGVAHIRQAFELPARKMTINAQVSCSATFDAPSIVQHRDSASAKWALITDASHIIFFV